MCVIKCCSKLPFHKKRFPPIYIASPLQQGANHITNNLLFFFTSKVTFLFFNYWDKNPLLWNCHISMELIWNISVHLYDFLQYVSSDAITDHIYVRKLSQWLHLYGFSPVCIIRCGLKLPFHKKGFIILVAFLWILFSTKELITDFIHSNMTFYIFN